MNLYTIEFACADSCCCYQSILEVSVDKRSFVSILDILSISTTPHEARSMLEEYAASDGDRAKHSFAGTKVPMRSIIGSCMVQNEQSDMETSHRKWATGAGDTNNQQQQDGSRHRMTMHEMEKMLQEKLERKTSRRDQLTRKILHLFEIQSNGHNSIDIPGFRNILLHFGVDAPDSVVREFFAHCNLRENNKITVSEFVHQLMPPDYDGSTETHGERAARREEENARNAHHACMRLLSTEREREEHKKTAANKRGNRVGRTLLALRGKLLQHAQGLTRHFQRILCMFEPLKQDGKECDGDINNISGDMLEISMKKFHKMVHRLGILMSPGECEHLYNTLLSRSSIPNTIALRLTDFVRSVMPPQYTVKRWLMERQQEIERRATHSQVQDKHHEDGNEQTPLTTRECEQLLQVTLAVVPLSMTNTDPTTGTHSGTRCEYD